MSSNRSQQSIGGAHKNGSASPATGRGAAPQKVPRARRLTTVLLDRDPICVRRSSRF